MKKVLEVIVRTLQMFVELGSEGLGDTCFLTSEEGLQEHTDSHVDVFGLDILSEMHLGMSFTHSDHRLNVPHSDGDSTNRA